MSHKNNDRRTSYAQKVAAAQQQQTATDDSIAYTQPPMAKLKRRAADEANSTKTAPKDARRPHHAAHTLKNLAEIQGEETTQKIDVLVARVPGLAKPAIEILLGRKDHLSLVIAAKLIAKTNPSSLEAKVKATLDYTSQFNTASLNQDGNLAPQLLQALLKHQKLEKGLHTGRITAGDLSATYKMIAVSPDLSSEARTLKALIQSHDGEQGFEQRQPT